LSTSIDGMTLLAAYHTAYNVVGVAVLLPATQWFTRVVERLLPSRQTALQRALDPSALVNPVIAVETARRVVATILTTTARSVAAVLSRRIGAATPGAAASAALAEVRDFLSELKEPPETEDEQHRLTSTLHALDHVSRLVDVLAEGGLAVGPDARAAALCIEAMRAAQAVGGSITGEAALSTQASAISWGVSPEVAAALAEGEGAAQALAALQRDHRATTLAAVAPGKLTAADAFARVDAARRLDRIAHHAWRSAAHLLGRG
jgi:phosphate:Na+ symporter